MKQLKIFLFLTLLGLQSFAQTLSPTVSPTSGGHATGNNGVSLSWSMGETFTATLSGGGNLLSQGEQQPEIDLFTGSTATSVCASRSFSVPYFAKGYVDPANVFTAQLSNASGSFASPVTIGTATGTLSGNINASIPAGTAPGTGYRVRVVSGNPARVAADNGANFTINTLSTAPTSITSTASSVLFGRSFTMTQVGGSLGSGASWKWYAGSVGGAPIGTGASITTSQARTTTYFVRAEGPCGNSNAASRTISIINGPATITTTAVNNTICKGSSVTLSVAGALCSGASWKWSKGSCSPNSSDNNLGVGQTLVVNPTSTTTYYVKSQGGNCAISACISVTITVLPVPATPGTISGATSVCTPITGSYSIGSVARATSYLWTVSGNATIVQAANGLSASVTFSNSFTTGTISVRGINCSGSGAIRSINISGKPTPTQPGVIVGPATVCRSSKGIVYSVPSESGYTFNWLFPTGSSITSGINTNSVKVTWGSVSGNVSVTKSNSCGISPASTKSVTAVACREAVDEVVQEETMNLYPNPASQMATLNFSSVKESDYSLRVINALGQSVLSMEGKASEGTNAIGLNLENLSSGLYVVQLVKEGTIRKLNLLKR